MKVLDSAADVNDVEFTVSFTDASKNKVVDNAVVVGHVNLSVNEETSLFSVADVEAEVGETVTLELSVGKMENIQMGSVALAFESSAFELVSGKWLLPNNPALANFDTTKGQGLGSFSYLMTSSAIEGAIFEVQLKVLDGAADVNDVEFTVSFTDASKNKVVDNAAVVGKVTVAPAYTINNKITVFELDVLATTAAGEYSLITVGKGSETYDFLSYDSSSNAMFVVIGAQKYYLYDVDNSIISVDSTTPINVALIYDDVKGTVRCYVNGNVAYYYENAESRKLVNDFSINDGAFMAATGDEEIYLYDGATLVDVYNINDSGTAEVVAFQEHNEESSIRILAGVDMPWYGLVGFEIEVYKDGVGQGVEVLSKNTIFESVKSNDKVVMAEEFGYRYFAVCAINNVDVSDGSSYYINVKPFTKVGETTYYGDAEIINIDANGNYSF